MSRANARTEQVGNPGGAEATLVRSQSSATVKRDGKGVASYEIKVYADDAEEAVSIALDLRGKIEAGLEASSPKVLTEGKGS